MITTTPTHAAKAGLWYALEHGHPFSRVWRAYVHGVDTAHPSATVYVEAREKTLALAKIVQGMALIERGRSLIDVDAINPDRVERYDRFSEVVDWYGDNPAVTRRATLALFAGGTHGDDLILRTESDRPVFLVSPELAGTLADHWMQAGRGGFLEPTRITRAKALKSGVKVDLSEDGLHRAYDDRRLIDSKGLLPGLLGDPDASLGESKGPHWAVQFQDGVTVHIHDFRRPKFRVANYYSMSSNDVRGYGRVRCWLADATGAHLTRELAGLAAALPGSTEWKS